MQPLEGSVVLVPNSMDSKCWLGLVVNQEVGEKWVDRNPCLYYIPPELNNPLLVRVLGFKLTEGETLFRSGIPEEEPRKVEVQHWAYIQTKPNPPQVIAGPDLKSISEFLRGSKICNRLWDGASFLHDLSLLVDYLSLETRSDDSLGQYEQKFLKMLSEVLPRN